MKRQKKIHSDEYWMGLALIEAMKAKGHTSPNPMVGAILVKNNKLIATGFHRQAGLPHAEIEVLRKIKNAQGSTLYVTLEPCCHTEKRTPPCTDTILKSGINRIVIGTLDPNPKVSGKGKKILRRAGIETNVGILQEDCESLNTFYNHWVVRRKPWVVLKAASSIDGRVATAKGQSRWISGAASRKWVHQLRSEVDAILVGIGTVSADNPRLTARGNKSFHQPIRIILDPEFKISERAHVLSNKNQNPCWVVISPRHQNQAKAIRLIKKGNDVLVCPTGGPQKFDLKKLLAILGRRNILSLLVEGGPGVWTSFIQQRCAQELLLFLAPKILGADAKPLFAPLGLKNLKATEKISLDSFEVFDEDLLLAYRFR